MWRQASLQVGRTNGRLSHFIVEPLCRHTDDQEFYVAIYSRREHDVLLFYEHGGVEVGDIDAKVRSLSFYLSILSGCIQARSIIVDVKLTDTQMALADDALDRLVGADVSNDAKA